MIILALGQMAVISERVGFQPTPCVRDRTISKVEPITEGKGGFRWRTGEMGVSGEAIRSGGAQSGMTRCSSKQRSSASASYRSTESRSTTASPYPSQRHVSRV